MKNFLILICIWTVLSQAQCQHTRTFSEAMIRKTEGICVGKSDWELIPHPFGCQSFYVCVNKVPELLECPQNYYFDQVENRCMPGSCPQIEDKEECPELSTRPLEGHCHKFEICVNGTHKRLECPSGYYYNTPFGICLPITDEPQHKCSCILPPYSIFKSDKNCQYFYICLDGQAVLEKCESGKYFNSYLNACVTDMDGVCLTKRSLTMNAEEMAVYEICKQTAEKAGSNNVRKLTLIPKTEDCSIYFMCIHNRAITKYCPPGFYFNSKLNFCEADPDGFACQALLSEQAQNENEEKNEKEIESSVIGYQVHYSTAKEKLTFKPNYAAEEKITEKQYVLDDKEYENNSAEVEEFDGNGEEWPDSIFKRPTSTLYEKLASKFISV